MKTTVALVAIIAAFSINVNAQNVTYEAVQIAQVTMERSWRTMEETMPMLYGQIETHFQKDGLSAGGASIFSDELKKLLNKDSFTRLFAQTISNRLSVDEQRQTLSFLLTPAGIKFQESMNETDDSRKLLLPMFKQACAAATTRAAGADRQFFQTNCSKF